MGAEREVASRRADVQQVADAPTIVQIAARDAVLFELHADAVLRLPRRVRQRVASQEQWAFRRGSYADRNELTGERGGEWCLVGRFEDEGHHAGALARDARYSKCAEPR